MKQGFLPATKEELQEQGITQPDFVYVIGDAYVDHPSFGPAIIGRVLESHGYSVAILSQPDWKNPESICIYGEPRLAFLVSSGNMDSMVNHYSVSIFPADTRNPSLGTPRMEIELSSFQSGCEIIPTE